VASPDALRRIARRMQSLSVEIQQTDRDLGVLVCQIAPDLLGETGGSAPEPISHDAS
jgi:hypothetical protein